MICWYCHWGWPEQTCEIYDRAAERLDEIGSDPYSVLHYGPGHIVWEDENFEDHSIQWCLEHGLEYPRDLTDEENRIAMESLQQLLAVPASIRCCEPEKYEDDGMHPELFPPPANIVMKPRR